MGSTQGTEVAVCFSRWSQRRNDCRQDVEQDLVVMTLNLQYFSSYPKDADKAEAKLKAALSASPAPDILCVQEGLASRNVISPAVGFKLEVCSAQSKLAQSVLEMVYGDPPALAACDSSSHGEMLCNQIYFNPESNWTVLDRGAIQISSDLDLSGGGGRTQGTLAIRSMVWTKLSIDRTGLFTASKRPCVYVMCTHLTGGRFEDQYFMQSLAEERKHQIDKIVNWYNKHSDPETDTGIIVGDFNATSVYLDSGPMASYFKAAIRAAEGVQQDARWKKSSNATQSMMERTVETQFKDYMCSPFAAVTSHEWQFAYDRYAVGYTSGFGHCIDHMAMSRPLRVRKAEVVYLTNQKFGNRKPDTDITLTDHNAVKTVFGITLPECQIARQRVFYTEYDFLNNLKNYRAVVHVSGFGDKQQYADPQDVVNRVAEALFKGFDSLDTHFGKGRWVCCYGGDKCSEEKPDVGFLVRQLQLQYSMNLFAVQALDVLTNLGGVDNHIDAVYYYPTEYTAEGQVAWGGFKEDGRTLVGATRIMLESNPLSGLPLFWLCAGGGDIAAGDMKAAFDRGMCILSIQAEAKYPQCDSSPYGQCPKIWDEMTNYEEIGTGDCCWRRKKFAPAE